MLSLRAEAPLLLFVSSRMRPRIPASHARSRRDARGPLTGGRRGFTLIELLVVVVIIGILAAISIPKFQATKGKAYYAGMRSDLHNLMTAQESYFYSHSAYADVLDSLKVPTSKGNTVVIVEATNTGWSATSENVNSYPHFCAIFMGAAAPVAPATVAGAVACQ